MIVRGAVAVTLAAVFILAPTAALAHAGHGDASELMNGFSPPITGLDHVLAMVAVGLLAAQLGGEMQHNSAGMVVLKREQ